jgi:hypothetical protein
MSAFLGADSFGRSSAAAGGEGKTAKERGVHVPPLDVSGDAARFGATGNLWEVVRQLSLMIGTPVCRAALAQMSGRSPRQISRDTLRMLEAGLITDRRDVQLVQDWKSRWDDLAVEKGTAGKKQAAIDRLAQDRRHHRRRLLVRNREGNWTEDGRVLVHCTGEIV